MYLLSVVLNMTSLRSQVGVGGGVKSEEEESEEESSRRRSRSRSRGMLEFYFKLTLEKIITFNFTLFTSIKQYVCII